MGLRGMGLKQLKNEAARLSPLHQGHRGRRASQRVSHTRVLNSAPLTGGPPAPHRVLPTRPRRLRHGCHGFPPAGMWGPVTSWPTAMELGDSGMSGWNRGRCAGSHVTRGGGHGTAEGRGPEPEGLWTPIPRCCVDTLRSHIGHTLKTRLPNTNAALYRPPCPGGPGPAPQHPPNSTL